MSDLDIWSGHLSNWQKSKRHGKITSGSHLHLPYDEIKVNRINFMKRTLWTIHRQECITSFRKWEKIKKIKIWRTWLTSVKWIKSPFAHIVNPISARRSGTKNTTINFFSRNTVFQLWVWFYLAIIVCTDVTLGLCITMCWCARTHHVWSSFFTSSLSQADDLLMNNLHCC